MHRYILIAAVLLSVNATAQHCPWDCSGMIMIRTDVTNAEFKQLNPVLAGSDKQIITDTIYGTGLDTKDTCRFFYYDDFVQYRTGKIKLHHWYGFDTAYYFAKGHYLVRYNFCKYYRSDTTLYVRYNDLHTGEQHFIEIPQDKRIHLHNYYREIYDRYTLDKIPSMQELILVLSRKDWGLPDK